MNNVAIKQDELDDLFNLETLETLDEIHIWLVKNKANNSILGGRNYSYSQAQQTLEKASKDYPFYNLEIIQAR
jgi:hypothetical protein